MVSERERWCWCAMRWMKWKGGATETIVPFHTCTLLCIHSSPSLLPELAESLTELEDLRRSLSESEERIQELEKEKEKRERKRREVSSFKNRYHLDYGILIRNQRNLIVFVIECNLKLRGRERKEMLLRGNVYSWSKLFRKERCCIYFGWEFDSVFSSGNDWKQIRRQWTKWLDWRRKWESQRRNCRGWEHFHILPCRGTMVISPINVKKNVIRSDSWTLSWSPQTAEDFPSQSRNSPSASTGQTDITHSTLINHKNT